MSHPNTASPAARPRLVLMWRGSVHTPHQPTNHAERFKPLFAALHAAGIETTAHVYFDAEGEAARDSLLGADGVLVWINPLQDGQDRTRVDALLRDVAAAGAWVSAHPDTILRMGTKEVLFQTQELGWGSNTDFYASFDDFRLRFPVRLSVAGPRVLKPLRGNDGQGVLKVVLVSRAEQSVQIQAASDDSIEVLPLAALMARLHAQHGDTLRMIDQSFQPNTAAGMVRCYVSGNRVVGFAEQSPRSDSDAFGMNSAKTMHPAAAPAFQDLRRDMEQDWIPGLQRRLKLDVAALPALWDADFLYRAPDDLAPSRFVLCEINVSSVSPFPETAAPLIAETVVAALRRRRFGNLTSTR